MMVTRTLSLDRCSSMQSTLAVSCHRRVAEQSSMPTSLPKESTLVWVRLMGRDRHAHHERLQLRGFRNDARTADLKRCTDFAQVAAASA